jgi:hypothetical protein
MVHSFLQNLLFAPPSFCYKLDVPLYLAPTPASKEAYRDFGWGPCTGVAEVLINCNARANQQIINDLGIASVKITRPGRNQHPQQRTWELSRVSSPFVYITGWGHSVRCPINKVGSQSVLPFSRVHPTRCQMFKWSDVVSPCTRQDTHITHTARPFQW